MSLIVQKFGGTSVATPEVIQKTAQHVLKAREAGHQVVVVVSAMAGVTSQLVDYVRQISVVPDPREYDVVASAGEQITCGLMALALKNLGLKAQSWLAWQVPILSHDTFMKSKIKEIEKPRLQKYLAEEGIPVVAGFQGVSPENHLTTLGRGGSDMTAVALAAALKADRCDLYKDVRGIYTADPKIVSKARKLNEITYEEMLELASQGSKVLQSQAVELAISHQVPLRIAPTFDEGAGTLIIQKKGMVHQSLVKGIVCNQDEARIALTGILDAAKVSADVFGALAAANLNVGMIVQESHSQEDATECLTFTAARSEADQVVALIKNRRDEIGFKEVVKDDRLAKISVVGVGMHRQSDLSQTLFKVLADRGVKLYGISTSETKVSLLIEEEYAELVVRALHTAFGLDEMTEKEHAQSTTAS